MRIAVVTTHPPSRATLSEYGYHLVRALRAKPGISDVILLADKVPGDTCHAGPQSEYSDLAPLRILPCWRFGAWSNALRILGAVRRCQPDVVFFNVQFATFGAGTVTAALGLAAPALVRLTGVPTVVLLHNIVEAVDLRGTGVATHPLEERLLRACGTLTTRLLLRADRVAVTLPRYVSILQQKYQARNVLFVPHGCFETPDAATAPASVMKRTGEPLRILTFGKFGTYKRVEALIEAYRVVQRQVAEPLELVIAGTDSPHARGYLRTVQRRYQGMARLRFTDYVAEEDIPALFQAATVVVLPYTGTTGSSGVLHLAGAYGKAVVLPRLGDLDDLVTGDGYTGAFFEAGSVPSLADALTDLLQDPARRRAIGEQNRRVAHARPLGAVVDTYLALFQDLCDLDQPSQPLSSLPQSMRWLLPRRVVCGLAGIVASRGLPLLAAATRSSVRRSRPPQPDREAR